MNRPPVDRSEQSPAEGTATNGRFQPGNKAALTHGAYAAGTRSAEVERIVGDLEAWQQQLVVDQGGEADLSTLRRSYLQRLVESEAVLRLIAANLHDKGVFSKGGRTRGAVNTYLRVLGSWDKLASRVGIDKRAKVVATMTPLEWIESVRRDPVDDTEPEP